MECAPPTDVDVMPRILTPDVPVASSEAVGIEPPWSCQFADAALGENVTTVGVSRILTGKNQDAENEMLLTEGPPKIAPLELPVFCTGATSMLKVLV